MTTRVTVEAVFGRDISVTSLDDTNSPVAPPVVVPSSTVETFHVWEGRRILIEELPLNHNIQRRSGLW